MDEKQLSGRNTYSKILIRRAKPHPELLHAWDHPRFYPSLAIFLVCTTIYSANLRSVGAGDCWAPSYIPLSILKEGNVDLDEFPGIRFAVTETLARGNRHRIFTSPILSGIAATPLYALAHLVGIPITRISVAYLSKFAATIYTSLSALFIFWTLRMLLPTKGALILTLVYAFGTCSWAISSQALWQHGLSQCLLAGAVHCLFRAVRKQRYAGYAGAFLSWAVMARYLDGIVATILFLYVLHRHRSQVTKFLLFSLPAVVFFLTYNYYYLDSPFALGSSWVWSRFDTSALGAAIALLFSPNRGLFFFSPVLFFSIAGSVRAWMGESEHKLLYRYLIISVLVFFVAVSKWFTWWGGHCYGYRMLVDIAPLLVVLLAPVYRLIQNSNPLRVLFIAGAAISIAIQMAGALYYDSTWNWKVADINRNPGNVWWLKDGEIIYTLKRAARNGWKVDRILIQPPQYRRADKRYL